MGADKSMTDDVVTGVTSVVGAKASVNEDDKSDDGAVVVTALDANDAADNEEDEAVSRVDVVGAVVPDDT